MTATIATENKIQLREIKEISISLSVKNLNPSIFTEEFLRTGNIIEDDLQLIKPPQKTAHFCQVKFNNNSSILAQSNRINFAEVISDKDLSDVKLGRTAHRCLDNLVNVEYQEIKIETKRLIPLPKNRDAARSYLSEYLIAAGSWQTYGKAPVKTGINFLYELDRRKLNMSISEATIHQSTKDGTKQKEIGGLLFTGSFKYPQFEDDSNPVKIGKIKYILENWREDWQEFQQIIDRVLLSKDDISLQRIMFS